MPDDGLYHCRCGFKTRWYHELATHVGDCDPPPAEVVQLSTRRVAAMSTADLKAAWDRYDGADEPGDPSGEEIHAELNKRGEGAYCAV